MAADYREVVIRHAGPTAEMAGRRARPAQRGGRYRLEVFPDEVDMPVGYVAGIWAYDRPRSANVIRQPILGLCKFD